MHEHTNSWHAICVCLCVCVVCASATTTDLRQRQNNNNNTNMKFHARELNKTFRIGIWGRQPFSLRAHIRNDCIYIYNIIMNINPSPSGKIALRTLLACAKRYDFILLPYSLTNRFDVPQHHTMHRLVWCCGGCLLRPSLSLSVSSLCIHFWNQNNNSISRKANALLYLRCIQTQTRRIFCISNVREMHNIYTLHKHECLTSASQHCTVVRLSGNVHLPPADKEKERKKNSVRVEHTKLMGINIQNSISWSCVPNGP